MAVNDLILRIIGEDRASNILKSIQATADALEKKTNTLSEGFKKVGDSLTGLGSKLSLAGAAITGAFGLMTKSTVSYGEQLYKLHGQTGIAVESLAKLGYAAEQECASMEALAIGLKFLQRNMVDALSGSSQAQKAFRFLGVAVTDSAGRLRSSEDVLLDIADAFKRLPDETVKTAVALDLFGRSGNELIPLLSMGSDKIRELGEEAEKTGRVWSESDVKAAKAFSDQLTYLNRSISGLVQTIGKDLIPLLAPLVDKFTTTIQQIRQWTEQNPELTKTILTIVGGLGAFLTVAGPFLIIIGTIAKTIGALITILGAASSAISLLASPIGIVIGVMALAVAGGVALYKNWDSIRNGANRLAQSLKSFSAVIYNSVVTGFNDAISWIENLPIRMYQAGREFFAAWLRGLTDTISKVKDRLKTIADEIFKFFGGGHSPAQVGPLSNLEVWGARLVSSYLEGARNTIPTLRSWLNSMLGNVQKAFSSFKITSSPFVIGPSLPSAELPKIQLLEPIPYTSSLTRGVPEVYRNTESLVNILVYNMKTIGEKIKDVGEKVKDAGNKITDAIKKITFPTIKTEGKPSLPKLEIWPLPPPASLFTPLQAEQEQEAIVPELATQPISIEIPEGTQIQIPVIVQGVPQVNLEPEEIYVTIPSTMTVNIPVAVGGTPTLELQPQTLMLTIPEGTTLTIPTTVTGVPNLELGQPESLTLAIPEGTTLQVPVAVTGTPTLELQQPETLTLAIPEGTKVIQEINVTGIPELELKPSSLLDLTIPEKAKVIQGVTVNGKPGIELVPTSPISLVIQQGDKVRIPVSVQGQPGYELIQPDKLSLTISPRTKVKVPIVVEGKPDLEIEPPQPISLTIPPETTIKQSVTIEGTPILELEPSEPIVLTIPEETVLRVQTIVEGTPDLELQQPETLTLTVPEGTTLQVPTVVTGTPAIELQPQTLTLTIPKGTTLQVPTTVTGTPALELEPPKERPKLDLSPYLSLAITELTSRLANIVFLPQKPQTMDLQSVFSRAINYVLDKLKSLEFKIDESTVKKEQSAVNNSLNEVFRKNMQELTKNIALAVPPPTPPSKGQAPSTVPVYTQAQVENMLRQIVELSGIKSVKNPKEEFAKLYADLLKRTPETSGIFKNVPTTQKTYWDKITWAMSQMNMSQLAIAIGMLGTVLMLLNKMLPTGGNAPLGPTGYVPPITELGKFASVSREEVARALSKTSTLLVLEDLGEQAEELTTQFANLPQYLQDGLIFLSNYSVSLKNLLSQWAQIRTEISLNNELEQEGVISKQQRIELAKKESEQLRNILVQTGQVKEIDKEIASLRSKQHEKLKEMLPIQDQIKIKNQQLLEINQKIAEERDKLQKLQEDDMYGANKAQIEATENVIKLYEEQAKEINRQIEQKQTIVDSLQKEIDYTNKLISLLETEKLKYPDPQEIDRVINELKLRMKQLSGDWGISFGNTLREAFAKVVQGQWKPALEQIANFFREKLLDKLVDIFTESKFYKQITKLVEDIGDVVWNIQPSQGTAMSVLATDWSKITSGLQSVVARLSSTSGAVSALILAFGVLAAEILAVYGLFKLFQSGFAKIWARIKDIWERFTKLIDRMVSTLFRPLVDAVGNVLIPLLDALAMITQTILVLFKPAIDFTASVLNVFAEWLRAGLKRLADTLNAFIHSVGAALGAFGTALVKFGAWLGDIGTPMQNLGNMLLYLANTLTNTNINLNEINNAIGNQQSEGGVQISEITGPTRDLLIELLSPLKSLDILPGLFESMRDAILQMRDAFLATIPENRFAGETVVNVYVDHLGSDYTADQMIDDISRKLGARINIMRARGGR